ncbi:MAG: DMT family transporter [Parasulfuritortus sp.]|jgi:drug/metabolite transporter (DMT)-like permease|nr:DMT family transporter [Parasulfuritortus sp.]
MFTSSRRLLAPLALMVAACTWGILWYPYRLLEQAGLSGSQSSLLTYLVSLLGILVVYPPRRPWPTGDRWLLIAVALSTGWTNLAYVLAVIQGEIMRVMLLFYLAPLWTVLFARLILGEKAGAWGWLVIVMSLFGAIVMLYDPQGGLPFPTCTAEWLGLSAGFTFALSNVLARRIKHVSTQRRSIWIFAGVILIALLPSISENNLPVQLAGMTVMNWGLVLLTGALLVLATFSVQYGLSHTPANRAIVILLTELVAAAFFSWYWAGEVMSGQEWLGGALIVAASLISGKMEGKADG